MVGSHAGTSATRLTEHPSGTRFTEQLSNASSVYEEVSPIGSPVSRDFPQDNDQRSGGQVGNRPSDRSRVPPDDPESSDSPWEKERNKVLVPQGRSQGSGILPPGLLGFRRSSFTSTVDDEPRKYCGLRLVWFIVLVVVVVILVLGVGLGVGLGLGLTQKNSSSKPTPTLPTPSPSTPTITHDKYLIGGAIDPAYYTKLGAFNGSGIALAPQPFANELANGLPGSVLMFYQHHSGDVRWFQFEGNGAWSGGTSGESIAADAKNSTTLSAVSYAIDGVNLWHVFYINKKNILKQRTINNLTNKWVDGPLNKLNLKANDADQVGMQACWYGTDTGDAEHTNSPSQGHSGNSKKSKQAGMRLWYASDSTTFQQLEWQDGDSQWAHQGTFTNKNGHAGVGCYTWGPGSVTYVTMVNQQDAVEIYWRDTNTSIQSTKAHPINEWVKAPVEIPNVNPSTSMGYVNSLYVQLKDSFITGYNISWAAEKTTLKQHSQFRVGNDRGVPGTHLATTLIPLSGGESNTLILFQVEGDDITEWMHNSIAGNWSSMSVPIPKH